jgi:hypothetical protein
LNASSCKTRLFNSTIFRRSHNHKQDKEHQNQDKIIELPKETQLNSPFVDWYITIVLKEDHDRVEANA